MEFKLRPWSLDDLESLVQHANNKKIADNLTDGFPFPYTREKGEAFIAFARKGDPVHIFAIEIDGKAVGGIGIHPQSDIHRQNAELGYWLSESYWGNGIIPRAIEEIVQYGFKKFEINRIFARPFGTNISSQKVLEKAGFKLEARIKGSIIKNDTVLDELIYARRRLS